MNEPGHMYQRLLAAVADSGSARSVYSQDTTLSRRSLKTRADKRARELASLGAGPGKIIALSMGNVVELLVLMLAASKLRAIAMPLDPANGDRPLQEACTRLPVSVVVRRPGGDEAGPYPLGYERESSKRLSGSLLQIDRLRPPAQLVDLRLPEDAEVVSESRGIAGVSRDTFRTGQQLAATGKAAGQALDLGPGTRLFCAEALVVPRYFDPIILGWLESGAQLSMAESSSLRGILPRDGYEQLVVYDTVRKFLELTRQFKGAAGQHEFTAVIPQATVPVSVGRDLQRAFGQPPRQLLGLEELGLIAVRQMVRGAIYQSLPGVELRVGAATEVGGHELLVHSTQAGRTVPAPPVPQPGSANLEYPDFVHTGYAVRTTRAGEISEVLGRNDSLVNLEGRRACLDSIEHAMLGHRRVTWVRAQLEHTQDGDPVVALEYVATGTTEVEDIEEHAIGDLPPFMVPRVFTRLQAVP